MEFLLNNLAESLMVMGALALIIEITVLGFATFVLFFLGLSLLITGGCMMLDILPATGSVAFWSNALVTAGLSLLLWQPLKKMQSKSDNKRVRSDFNEHHFTLAENVDDQGLTQYQYSGISWKLKSQIPLTAGTRVRIAHSEVGVLWVEATDVADNH